LILNNSKSGESMFTKTLLALSYLTLIPASQSFADYTIAAVSSEDEEFEGPTDEDKNRIHPLIVTALVGTVFAVTAGIIYALNKKGNPRAVVKSEQIVDPETPIVSSKDSLLASLSEYLGKMETGKDNLLSNFKTARATDYRKNSAIISDQEFSIAFATYFFESLQNIVGNLPDNHPLTLNLKNSFELLEMGVKAKSFKQYLLTDIVNITGYHANSTTPVNALDNQRIYLEVLTAFLDSFVKARKDFYDDNRLISSLINPNIQSVESSFITVQEQLNQVSASITQLFRNPSEQAFEGFNQWLSVHVVHKLIDAIHAAFPAPKNGSGELPNIIQYIEDVRSISPDSINSENSYNRTLEKFIKALIAAQ
jgi:hypothetical protein